MKKIRNSKLKAEYGKARVEMMLEDLTISINNIEFLQVAPKLRAFVSYVYDRGYPPTEDDPGVLPLIECTHIRLQQVAVFAEDRNNIHMKAYVNVDVLPYLTEECLKRIDGQLEAELKEEALWQIDEPEDGLYSHNVPWRNSYNRLKAKRAMK